MIFDVFVAFTEPRIPVGIGILAWYFELIGGGKGRGREKYCRGRDNGVASQGPLLLDECKAGYM